MTIGERVKKLRKEKGMTQEELAARLGYKSKSSVTHIENGRDIPRSVVVQLADILDTTPAYLMGWEDSSYNQMPNPPRLANSSSLIMFISASPNKLKKTG